MKIVKITLIVIGVIAVFSLVFLFYLGFFDNSQVHERQEGGYKIAGIKITGPYSEAGKYIANVENILKTSGINAGNGFGIYYDDPESTPAKECRSLVGCIITETDSAKLAQLQLNGLILDSIQKAKSFVLEFPIKNSLSYMIGPMKAYSVLSKYMEERKCRAVMTYEIYDYAGRKIFYVMQNTCE